jgi:arylsulfatase A-like enzyme
MEEVKDSLSLRHILEGNDKIHRKYQISALDLSKVGVKEWKMISDGEFKLVVENGDKYRLYNLKDDPWENSDISENHPQILKKLIKELNFIYTNS